MAQNNTTWKPPVSFHFRVDFQWGTNKASASFLEVDGLGQSLKTVPQAGRKEETMQLPNNIENEDIVLKRAIEPLSEPLTKWIAGCFNFLDGGKIEPCTIIISLLDENRKAVARWVCLRAIPFKWKVNPLEAKESKIAVETLTLKHTKLIRNI
jgi:phage tail-like protein